MLPSTAVLATFTIPFAAEHAANPGALIDTLLSMGVDALDLAEHTLSPEGARRFIAGCETALLEHQRREEGLQARHLERAAGLQRRLENNLRYYRGICPDPRGSVRIGPQWADELRRKREGVRMEMDQFPYAIAAENYCLRREAEVLNREFRRAKLAIWFQIASAMEAAYIRPPPAPKNRWGVACISTGEVLSRHETEQDAQAYLNRYVEERWHVELVMCR